MENPFEPDKIKQDWLILADGAQVQNGKLYVMGGGWDRIVINQPFPANHAMAIALGIRVPWNEANRRHQFKLTIVDAEGQEKIMDGGGDFEVGRAAGSIPGQDQRVQFALTLSLQLKREGEYSVIVEVDGIQLERTPFYVTLTPAMRAQLEDANRKKGA